MALQVVAGEPLISYITLLDNASNPIMGETFTLVTSVRPDGAAFPITVVEIGNGVYRMEGATAKTDPPGEWFALVKGVATERPFQETWDVSATTPPITVAQESPGGGLTRKELRLQISADLGDYYPFTATHEGTESSVIDRVHFAREIHHFRGMEITFTGGTPQNVGLARFIQASASESQSVSFAPELPMPVQVGDSGELHNYRGKGWTFSEYNAAINAAIDRAGEMHATVPLVIDVSVPFDKREPYIYIPEPMNHFGGLQYIDSRGTRQMVPVRYWWIEHATASVVIDRRFAQTMHGRTLRLTGHARPATLTEDAHRTAVPAEWLVMEVKAILAEADITSSSSQGNRDRLFNANRSGADARRQLVISRYGPNTTRIR